MADWQTVSLGDALTFQRGFDITKDEQRDGPYPVISSSGPKTNHAEFKVRGPGVIIGRKGSLGTVFYSDSDYWPHDTTLWIKDFHGNHPRFAYYFLQTMGFERLDAGASNPSLNRNHIHTIPVRFPPLPVQRRIAGILSAYDELMENSQRRIRLLEAMARALYREWFVHFRFPGHEKHPRVASPLGDIPQGWEVKSIQQFGTVITGKTPSKANADFYGNDVPFVKTPDMHGNMFILGTSDCLSTAGAESQANKTLPAGSICVSCIGTIGVVSITTEGCQTNQQINSVVLTNPASREFLFLRLLDSKQALENLGANGATMGNVNKGKFEAMEIVCPSDDVLARYHRLVEPMFSEILGLFRQIQNLRRTRDLLLPRLLSGQVELETEAV